MRCLSVALWLACVALGQDFYLQQGDRVLFLGGTDPARRLFTAYTETYVLTRFPEREVSIAHAWSGEAGIATFRPGVVVLLLGLDETPCRAEGFAAWAATNRRLLTDLKENAPGARVTAIRPTPCPDAAARERVDAVMKDVTALERVLVVDLDAPLSAAVEKAKRTDPQLAAAILPDRFRPGLAGHLLMAQHLLAAWRAPALVSALEVEAMGKEYRRAENVETRELEADRVVGWTQMERALPMPFEFTEPAVWLAVLSSGFVQALDQQTLRVSGLVADRYRFTIDGEAVGVFTKQKMDEGINLALLLTPMSRQAEQVHALTLKRHELLASRRTPRSKEAAAALETQDAELVEQQRSQSKPRLHDYEFQPVE